MYQSKYDSESQSNPKLLTMQLIWYMVSTAALCMDMLHVVINRTITRIKIGDRSLFPHTRRKANNKPEYDSERRILPSNRVLLLTRSDILLLQIQ